MTPYARCSTRLNQHRQAENAAWCRAPCDSCAGEGRGMAMKCYGGMPFEVEVDCPDCGGRGYTLRQDPRATGVRAHRRINVLERLAARRVRHDIAGKVRVEGERKGFLDVARRVADALRRSRLAGTSIRRTQARG